MLTEEQAQQAWREGVVASLAKIETQLSRIASDRESEKETINRLSQDLRAADLRAVEKLDKHIEWNDEAHEDLHEKINKVSHRVSLITGAGLTIQFILTLAVGAIALLK